MQAGLSRRRFLRTTSAAALTGPLLVHAAEPAFARKASHDRITLGVIGTGTHKAGA